MVTFACTARRWAMAFSLLASARSSLSHAGTGTPTPPAMTLPPRLRRTASEGLLVRPRPDIYVLGTVHIGSESAEEASELIEHLRPRAVVLEVAPSRVGRIRREVEDRRSRSVDNDDDDDDDSKTMKSSSSLLGPIGVLRSLPALAERGWSTGGLSGLLFATIIVWSSLLKRSTTKGEEEQTLPRRDEFAAAIEAADAVGASVVAADWEFEELLGAMAQSVSPWGWASLGLAASSEALGLREADPLQRRKGETVMEWAARRRDTRTANASKQHGETLSPEFSSVLVDMRDARFAESCLKSMEPDADDRTGNGHGATVCVVGLVHLDGVVKRLCQ